MHPARDTGTDLNNVKFSGEVLDRRNLRVGENHAFTVVSGDSGNDALLATADAGKPGDFAAAVVPPA